MLREASWNLSPLSLLLSFFCEETRNSEFKKKKKNYGFVPGSYNKYIYKRLYPILQSFREWNAKRENE